MPDHPNAARYREMSATMRNGDLDMAALAEGVADDVEWWEIGLSEPIRGKQALLERMQAWEGYAFKADLHDVVANDEHTIALLDVTATRGDESLDYRVAEIYHIDADGRVTHRWAFSDDTAAITDFFGQPG
ncbi:MAG: nuclear transport factor 2 family protein [Acidimicrobiia bacterium]